MERPHRNLKRKTAQVAVRMIFPDQPESWPDSVLNDFPGECEVQCLSQTVRRSSDDEVGQRPAIVVSEDGFCWSDAISSGEFCHLMMQTVVCAEAFKVLEGDFSELLRSRGNMKSYSNTIEVLRDFVVVVADELNYPVHDLMWNNVVPFGLFSHVLANLIRCRDRERELLESIHDDKMDLDKRGVEMLDERINLGKMLFMEVVLDGISELKELWKESCPDDEDKLQASMDIMMDESQFEETVKEWSFLGSKRSDRNEYSHPFSGLSSDKQRAAALDYYEKEIVSDTYSKEFPNVVRLALVKLKVEEVSLRGNAIQNKIFSKFELLLADRQEETRATNNQEVGNNSVSGGEEADVTSDLSSDGSGNTTSSGNSGSFFHGGKDQSFEA